MIPPPLTSTLFPYTTLFRSLAGDHLKAVGELEDVGGRGRERPRVLGLGRSGQHQLRRQVDRNRASDRKSTRLNSSHSQISYAVFCLKKKKNISYNITHQICG